ncbi:MAG TPA: hypothetical protein VGM21_01765 [Actinomycetota bacterium]
MAALRARLHRLVALPAPRPPGTDRAVHDLVPVAPLHHLVTPALLGPRVAEGTVDHLVASRPLDHLVPRRAVTA